MKTITYQSELCVVGGGLAGILCAYRLQTLGVNCVLVEAERILRGVTENTTAKITVQHGLIYDNIIKKYGLEAAQMYFKAQRESVELYQKMSCDIDKSMIY